MANDNFNADMNNYIKKMRKKRTDPIDYDSGKAKSSKKRTDEVVEDIPEDEIIIEEKEIGGIKRFFLKLFRKSKVGDEVEVETYEEEIPEEEAEELIEEVEEEFDEDFEDIEGRSLFDVLFSWLKPRKLNVEEEFDEELMEDKIAQKNSEVLKDAKEVFKAVNHWLDQLEPDKKRDFKNSEDFIIYRKFLKKYKLIKD